MVSLKTAVGRKSSVVSQGGGKSRSGARKTRSKH